MVPAAKMVEKAANTAAAASKTEAKGAGSRSAADRRDTQTRCPARTPRLHGFS